MQPKDLIRQNLEQSNLMQLATSSDDQPWACTVHFYSDADFNLYWVSSTERKHSKDISKNPKVAATIAVHEDSLDENYVIGVSLQGVAELVEEPVEDEVVQNYISKLGKDPADTANIAAGHSHHKFYRLKPTKIVLFDTKNFGGNPRQEWFPDKT